MTTQEALSLLSDVKLGVELGIIPNVDPNVLKQLIVLTRASSSSAGYGAGASAPRKGVAASQLDSGYVEMSAYKMVQKGWWRDVWPFY